MQFSDITQHIFDKIKNDNKFKDLILFSKKHAEKIIKFLDKINKIDKDIVLVVHCDAGISRSGAVGTFAVNYLNLDKIKFQKHYLNRIYPNKYVLDILNKESNLTNSYLKDLRELFK